LGIGLIIRQKGKENLFIQMELSIKEIDLKEKDMAKEMK